jgi:hypothetical protein
VAAALHPHQSRYGLSNTKREKKEKRTINYLNKNYPTFPFPIFPWPIAFNNFSSFSLMT